MSNKAGNTIRTLVEGGIMVAVAVALGFFKLEIWAYGGSVSLIMLPIVVFAWRRGFLWGIGAGFVLGLLDGIIDGGIAWGWQSLILDYSVAYAALGMAGLFRGIKWGLLWGTLVAGLSRFAIHFISGVTIFRSWMADEYMGLVMPNVYVYSFLYNGSYMVLAIAITALAAWCLRKPLCAYDEGS